MKAMTVNEAITGRVSGTAKRTRNWRWLQPSSRAASRISPGIPRKPWRMRKVPNAAAANGTMRPW